MAPGPDSMSMSSGFKGGFGFKGDHVKQRGPPLGYVKASDYKNAGGPRPPPVKRLLNFFKAWVAQLPLAASCDFKPATSRNSMAPQHSRATAVPFYPRNSQPPRSPHDKKVRDWNHFFAEPKYQCAAVVATP